MLNLERASSILKSSDDFVHDSIVVGWVGSLVDITGDGFSPRLHLICLLIKACKTQPTIILEEERVAFLYSLKVR